MLGILSAGHNEYGMNGGVPAAIPYISTNFYSPITVVLDPLMPGDAVILEQALTEDPQLLCPPSLYGGGIPMERDDSVFAQLQVMSANGYVIYEPAGNDAQNLEAGCYGGDFTRTGRDSGAILVGASGVTGASDLSYRVCDDSTPDALTTAAIFSNYSSRIDLNGWGFCIPTTGALSDDVDGDLHAASPTDARENYTAFFSGTSGATPIVAAAGIALSGWVKNRPSALTYNPQIVRSLLQRFGTPYTGSHPIGIRPNASATLAYLMADPNSEGVLVGDEIALGQDLIEHYYLSALGHAAWYDGKIYWRGEVERLRSFGADPRETYRVIAKNFYKSAEYAARNRLDTQYISDLYATFFNRTPSGSELSYWLGELSGGKPRDFALSGFMLAGEFDTFMDSTFTASSQRLEVGLVLDQYRAGLARLPDNFGLATKLGALNAAILLGVSQVTAEANLEVQDVFASAEYLARSRSNPEFLTDLYDLILRRAPDPSGFAYYMGLLTGGTSRPAIVSSFLASVEWGTRMTAIASQ